VNSVKQYECIKKYISSLKYPDEDIFISINVKDIKTVSNMEQIL